MEKKKILIAATVTRFLGFEKNDIKILQEQGFLVETVTNIKNEHNTRIIAALEQQNVTMHHVSFTRSPFSKQVFVAYKNLKNLLNHTHYEMIHCHTPVAGILTRLAARKARKKGTKVIYTAHGFHFYKGAPLKSWLLYYPTEKLCSYFTDALITINHEDYTLAQKKMKAKKIYYIPGVGINTSKFSTVEIDVFVKRKELGLATDDIVLISVGELNVNKNHQIIIKALGKLQDPQIHYCIAGIGDQQESLLRLAREQGVEHQVHLLGYRTDVGELLKVADVFCFPSIREGLGLAALEAMCAGLPLLTSDTRGINEYSQDGISGYKYMYNDCDGFAKGIRILASNQLLREQFGKNNQLSVKRFDLKNVMKVMKTIYEEVQDE